MNERVVEITNQPSDGLRQLQNLVEGAKHPARTFCPQCGFGVLVDEDGLCSGCGSTASGPFVDRLCETLNAVGDTVARLHEAWEQVEQLRGENAALREVRRLRAALRQAIRLAEELGYLRLRGKQCDALDRLRKIARPRRGVGRTE